jgi:hypothetical protein
LNEEPGLVVLNYVAQTARVEGDNRGLAEKCLDRDQAETFVGRRNDQRRSALVERRQVCLRDLSMPADPTPQSQLLSERLE